MSSIKRQLELSRNQVTDLQTGYRSVLEFIDKMEHLGQLQDRLDITCDVERIWEVLSREVQLFAAAEVCALFMVDDTTHDFVLQSVSPDGSGDRCRREMDLQIECGTFSWIINRRQPSIIPSLAFKKDRTVIMLPLSTARKTLGSVMLLTPIKDSAITQETLKLLGMIARQCSLVMENSLLYDSLRKEHESLKYAQAQVLQAEKLASIGRLTAGAFHEILNPMNIISGYLQLLQMKAPEDSGFGGYVTTMREQSDRVTNIVKDLLKFSQFPKKNVTRVRIDEIVENVLKLGKHELKFDQVTIACELDPALTMIHADGESLSQVFLNLLSNAGDAMDAGGTLQISTRPAAGNGDSPRNGGMVEILFRDNGGGIPDKDLSRIFDPFFTTKETGKGTGLGLSISYGIIQEHGGYIKVGDTDETGTTFIVGLPAAHD